MEKMVEVVVDQKPRAKFSPKDEKDVMLSVERMAVSATVMSADEATAAFRRRMNWIFGGLASVSFVMIVGISMFADEMDAAIVRSFAALILVALMGFVFFIRRRRMNAWNDRIARRIAAVAEVGSLVQLDDAGIELGGRIFAWPTVTIDKVEFIQASSEDSRYFIIERLLLSAAGRSIVLDSALMHNGRQIVDNVWRRLRRAAI